MLPMRSKGCGPYLLVGLTAFFKKKEGCASSKANKKIRTTPFAAHGKHRTLADLFGHIINLQFIRKKEKAQFRFYYFSFEIMFLGSFCKLKNNKNNI